MDTAGLAPDDFPWDALYRAITPFLTRILFCLRVPEHDSQDIAQDVRLTIFRKAIQPLPQEHPIQRWIRGESDANSHLRHWVGVIAYHVVLNYRTAAPRRRERFSPDGSMHIVADSPSAARLVADAERLREVEHLLDELAEEHRLVLVMHYFEGKTTEAIAAELGIPQGTVFSRLGRARAEMKTVIQRKVPQALQLMLGTDMDPAVQDLSPFADGDSAARSEADGAPWLELFALVLLFGVRGLATRPQDAVAQPEQRSTTAAPIGRALSGKRAIAPLVAAPLVFMGACLGGPCVGQTYVARTLPRPTFPIFTPISFAQEPFRPAPTNESVLRENDKLASPAPLGDSAPESTAPEPDVEEVPDPSTVIRGEASDEEQLRPWFLPVDITWPTYFWRTSPMNPVKPAAFVPPLVALCLNGMGCEPGNPPGPDPSVLAAGGAGGAGAGGSGGTGGTGGVTCVPTGMENCGTPEDEDCDGLTPPCNGTALWSKKFVGSPGNVYGTQVALEPNGNVLMTGQFSGSADFGSGSVTSAGDYDLFIAKLDASGNHLWSRRFGDSAAQVANGIAVDADGNVLVAGDFWGTIDFGKGPMTSAGMNDIFVVKLDPAGNVLWSKRFGDNSSQYAWSIAPDSGGNIWVGGGFSGTVDFGSTPLSSTGSQDIFVTKLSPTGDHLLSKRFGDPAYQALRRIAVDAAGDVLLTGYFSGIVDFGGSPLQSAGSDDVFVVKLNATGAHVFSKRFGSANGQYAYEMALTDTGEPLVVGTYDGTVDFGGGGLSSAGGSDIFITALDTSGQHRWSHRFGDSGEQSGIGVAVDGLGNVWMTGSFFGAVDFGGGTLASAGGKDVFLARVDSMGNALWSRGFGDAAEQVGTSLAGGSDGTVVMAGYFSGTLDFGLGPLTSQGGVGTFLTKFSE